MGVDDLTVPVCDDGVRETGVHRGYGPEIHRGGVGSIWTRSTLVRGGRGVRVKSDSRQPSRGERT